MLFDFGKLTAQEKYKLLTAVVVPRPIAWVVSRSSEGRLNCAPFSFFNAFSGDPPIVCIGIGAREGRPKDTAVNIQRTGEFVVNLVPERLAQQMNVTAIDFEPDVCEIDAAGLETIAGVTIGTPRLAASPVALECKRMVTLEIGIGRSIIVGVVNAVHIDDEFVLNGDRCHVDTPRLHLVGRMHGGGWYTRTNEQFLLPRIQEQEWRAQRVDEIDETSR